MALRKVGFKELPPLAQEVIVDAWGAVIKPEAPVTEIPVSRQPKREKIVMALATELAHNGVGVSQQGEILTAIFKPASKESLKGVQLQSIPKKTGQ